MIDASNNLLCDCTLKLDSNKDFPVHRIVLAACSPYFRALFTNGLTKTTNQIVQLDEVDEDSLACILDWAYSRKALINTHNIERLMLAIDRFQIDGLIKQCTDFLLEHLSAENVIGIRKFAKDYFWQELYDESHIYLMKNYQHCFDKSNELTMLNVEEFSEIITCDDLNVRTEEIVYHSVMNWIDRDPDTRKIEIVRLIQCVRLGLLSTQFFIKDLKGHPYIKEQEQCKPLIIETLRYLYELDLDSNMDIDMMDPITKPRIPHEILFVVGGWSGGSPTSVVEMYDTRTDKWIRLNHSDSSPRAYHGSVTLNDKIYIIGGFDGVDYFNSCRKFDPVTKEWSDVAPMNFRRCYVSIAILDDKIFAMGGFDGHVRQNSTEIYSPTTNQWSMGAPMHAQRSDASAATLKDRIYICGGFNGQECLDSAEYYDGKSKQWTLISHMRNRRSGVGVTAYRGKLYAIGGFNGITRMNSGERYAPETNIEVLDDLMFAIGGFNGVTTIHNVECYDDDTGEWYDASNMNLYRSALSVCVLSGLKNVRDFIIYGREQERVKKPVPIRGHIGDNNQMTAGNSTPNNQSNNSTLSTNNRHFSNLRSSLVAINRAQTNTTSTLSSQITTATILPIHNSSSTSDIREAIQNITLNNNNSILENNSNRPTVNNRTTTNNRSTATSRSTLSM
ncbi:hypothetical protein SNEBB_009634 [Seison nebaliae]|nr:hypothetical protein SNEBB_009634 [Seison nebaliae]